MRSRGAPIGEHLVCFPVHCSFAALARAKGIRSCSMRNLPAVKSWRQARLFGGEVGKRSGAVAGVRDGKVLEAGGVSMRSDAVWESGRARR